MVQVFNRSKINLNFRWCSRSPSHGQIKGRDFEVLGCGEFMLATKHFECEDLYELYTPGVDFVECELDELPEQIEYWLKNDTLREEIARNAYKKRRSNLWTTRLKKFLGDWEDLK
jgi:spore maturation protein CgeB